MIRRLQVSDPRFARLREAVRTEPRVRTATFVLIAGVLTAVALLVAPPATVTYSVGAVADRAIRAPRSVSFVSESLTEAERNKAEAAAPKQFATDLAIVTSASARVASAPTAISRIRGDAAETRDQKIAALPQLSDAALTPASAPPTVDMPQPDGDQVAARRDNAPRTLASHGRPADEPAPAVAATV